MYFYKFLGGLLLLSQSLNWTASHYNCSHSYVLSVNDTPYQYGATDNLNCKDSCLQATPALVVSTEPDCTLLQHILKNYDSVIPEEDCLELQFMPGEYRLSSLSKIQVTYSMVLSAPWGGVSMACSEDASTVCGNDGGVISADNFMMAVNGSQTRDVFVFVDSLSFSNCSKRIQFNSLHNLTISNSTFKGFASSAVDIFNVDNVLIQDCTFTDSISNATNSQYRSNAGALSVAYFYMDNFVFPQLNILGCTFKNNSAYIQDVAQQNLVFDGVVSGRGGGLGILTQGNTSSVNITIRDSTFIDGYAEAYGAGIWTAFLGDSTYHDLFLENCTFKGNSGVLRGLGGGLTVGLLLRNVDDTRPVRIVVIDCLFEDNSARSGGGIGIWEIYTQSRGNELAVFNTRFVRNKASANGAAISLETTNNVQNRRERRFYNFTDCVFHNNEALEGTFGTGFNRVNFFGTNVFTQNIGPALRLVGALLVVYGNLTFVENTVPSNVKGGAMFIQAFGQVKLMYRADISFVNNTGGTGAAIVVEVQQASPVFLELLFNPQCFLIYEDSTVSPGEWDDVSILFSGNEAVIGPAVYISHLQHCSWYGTYRIGDNVTNEFKTIFSTSQFRNWTVFNFEGRNTARFHQKDGNSSKFYVQTEPFKITSSVEMDNLTMRPGERVQINLTALDQFDNPTNLIARVFDTRSVTNLGAFRQVGRPTLDQSSLTSMVVFDPSLLPVDPAVGMANLTCGISNSTIRTGLVPITIDTPFNVLEIDALDFNVTLDYCQPGYDLVKVNGIYTCTCSKKDPHILICDGNGLILQDGTWAGNELGPDPSLDITVCPVPYCQCVERESPKSCEKLYIPDSPEQCHPTRQGTLCGQCMNGTSVGVLRTNCRECTRDRFFAIALLIVGDVLVLGVVFFVIMKLDFHFPYSLKGLLFYIQTIYYATESFPASFWDVRKYMLFTTSALSLYFPWDFCLSPKMEALVTFVVKFIPPLIASVMSVVAVVLAYVLRSRIGRRQVWKAIWFLILLLYSPLLHTCIAILKCPVIHSASGNKAKRWFYDGEVSCFQTPAHVALSTLAILVLTPLVLLVPALFIYTFHRSMKIKVKYRTLEWITEALNEGYKDSTMAQYYAAWELTRRLLLISIVVALPGRSVAALYVVVICFAVHMFVSPYKKRFQNVIETAILFTYILLLLIRSNQTILLTVNSERYSGNLVPDTIGRSIPKMDQVAWLFFPFFYSPLVFGVFFIVGALIYRIIKSSKQWKDKRKNEVTQDELDLQNYSMNFAARKVSTTTVDAPD